MFRYLLQRSFQDSFQGSSQSGFKVRYIEDPLKSVWVRDVLSPKPQTVNHKPMRKAGESCRPGIGSFDWSGRICCTLARGGGGHSDFGLGFRGFGTFA